ncbi:MAG: GNAT family N-acetyltransferase [Promethearchaeia archaeon]
MKKKIKLENGETVVIRHLKKADVEGIWRNFNEVVEEGIYLPVLTPVLSDYEKYSWYKSLKKNGELCMVADNLNLEPPNNIIGQCEITNTEWEAGEHVGILGIIINKKYRNMGLGKQLIDFAIREAKKVNNKKKLILSCFSHNEHAINLYKKMGFEIVGLRKKQYYMNSRFYDEVLMDLWIDDYLNKFSEK